MYEKDNHIYTLNLHTTTCRVMVNGPSYTQFIDEDIQTVIEIIDGMADELSVANAETKTHIDRKLADHHIKNPKPQKTYTTSKTYPKRTLNGIPKREQTEDEKVVDILEKEMASENMNIIDQDHDTAVTKYEIMSSRSKLSTF